MTHSGKGEPTTKTKGNQNNNDNDIHDGNATAEAKLIKTTAANNPTGKQLKMA